jgi:endonuclease/exonuclease/phosphatase (EEP) superfamily protein YafD
MWRKILQGIGILAAILSLLPLLAADFWWIRVFDFLHVYFTVFTLVALLIYFVTFNTSNIKDYVFVVILLSCFCFQLFRICDYLGVYRVEVQESTANIPAQDELMVYTANVLEKNDTSQPLIDEIKNLQPDIVVFTETNTKWQNKIQSGLGDLYDYKVSYPLDNTYGMILYSKLQLIDPQVKFQSDPEIPSIHTKVQMKNGEIIQVYAIHPTPPLPQHNPQSTDRDQELLKTAILTYTN